MLVFVSESLHKYQNIGLYFRLELKRKYLALLFKYDLALKGLKQN